MAGLHFDITGENGNFLSALNGAQNGVKNAANAMEQYGQQIEDMFSRMKNAAELAVAGFSVKGFAEKIALTRGEFQQLEIAFKTMLGSAEQASTLMDQLVNTAATTPFDLKGVADGAKQLLAYGTEASEVNEVLVRLGDIAAGLSLPLGDLVYLYGTTMTQGQMFTQDLRQFMGRGIPMADELAKIFGVAKDEVAGLVTAGKVGAAQVKQAIVNMTSEGGKFGGLMAAQSASITGQISNIEDAIDMMFNDMGKSSEGAMNTALSGVSYAVENYKKFGAVLLSIVAAYGEWKAAAMVVSGWRGMISKQTSGIEETRQSELTSLAQKYTNNGDAAETAATTADTAAQEKNTIARNANKSAIDAQIASIEAAMKAKLSEAETTLAAAKEEQQLALAQATSAETAVKMREKDLAAAVASGDGLRIEAAEMELNKAALDQNTASRRLAAAQKNVATATTARNTAAERLNTLQTEADTIQRKANATATGLWAAVTRSATTAVKGLTASIAANPFTALTMGITTALMLIPAFTSDVEETSEEITRFGETAVKQLDNVQTLMAVIESTSTSSNTHKDALDELCKVYEEYGLHIDDESDKMQQLVALHDELVGKIQAEGEERQKANLLQSYSEGITKAAEEMRTAWAEAYKDAEYEGVGILGQFNDATAFQERANQLTPVVSAIAQNEMQKLQDIVQNGGQVTQEQIDEVIANTKAKIIEKSQEIAGASAYALNSYDENGEELKRKSIDVDYEGILESYAQKTLNLTEARKKLTDSMKEGADAAKDDAEAVDYSSMKLDELISQAYGASDAFDDMSDKEAAPKVDTTSTENAEKKAKDAKTAMNALGDTTAKPFVDTSSIGTAITEVGTLLNRLNKLGGGKTPQFKFNTKEVKLGFDASDFGGGATPWAKQQGTPKQDAPKQEAPKQNNKAAALAELNNRVNAANTNEKVDTLLKSINTNIDTAEYGSDTYNQLQALKKRLEDRKSKYSGKNKKSSSGKSTAEKVADAQDKLQDLLDETEKKQIRTVEDLTAKVTNAQIEAEGNSAEAARKKREQENKEEIQSIERERDDTIQAYVDAQEKIFDARENVKKAQNSKYKVKKFDASAVDTSSITAQYDELIALTKQKQQNALSDDYDPSSDKAAKEAKIVGDIMAMEKSISEMKAKGETEAVAKMEQRLAYAKAMLQISQTQSKIDFLKGSEDPRQRHEGNLMELQSQRAQINPADTYALASNDRAITQENERYADEVTKLNLGFTEAWQNFQNLSTTALERLKEQLQAAVTQGVDGQKISEELRKELQQKLDEVGVQQASMRAYEGGGAFGQSGVFGQNGLLGGTAIGRFGQMRQDVQSAQDTHAYYKDKADTARAEAEEAKTKYGENSAQYKQAKGKQDKAEEDEKQSKNALDGLKSGLTTAGVGLFVNAANANAQSMAEAGKKLFGEGSDAANTIGKFAESSQYATDAFNSLSQGDFIGAAMNLGEAVSSLGEMFGFWSNSNLQDWMETNDGLSNSLDVLTEAVDALTDEMKDQDAAEAAQTKEQAVRTLQAAEETAQSKLLNNASLHDGGHSLQHEFNGNGWGRKAVTAVNNALADITGNEEYRNRGNSLEDFLRLSAQEMNLLYKTENGTNALTAVKQIIMEESDDGNYGAQGDMNKDITEYMQTYSKEAYEAIEDSFYETVNGLSFDSFKDNFLSMMMDLNSEVDDFADNFTESLTKAVVNDTLKSKYNDELQTLYNDLGELVSNSETMSVTEYNMKMWELQERQADISARMIDDRNAISAATGYSENENQKATAASIQNITQDQADQLVGRITAIQIAVEASKAATMEQAQAVLNSYNLLTSISSNSTMANAHLSDILVQAAQSNSYLSDIAKTQKAIFGELDGRIEKMQRKLDTL